MMLKRLTGSNSVKIAFVLFLAALLLAGGAEIAQHQNASIGKSHLSKAETKLKDLEQEMKSSLEKIKVFKTEVDFHDFSLHSGFEDNGFSFYVLKNNKIIYWSNNEPVVTNEDLTSNVQGKFLSLPNGDFLLYSNANGDQKYIGLILLRHNYDYENKYLVNGFNKTLDLSSSFIAGSKIKIPPASHSKKPNDSAGYIRVPIHTFCQQYCVH